MSVLDDPLPLVHLAEEVRTIAENTADEGAKRTLLGIAETYEKMAEQIERRVPKP